MQTCCHNHAVHTQAVHQHRLLMHVRVSFSSALWCMGTLPKVQHEQDRIESHRHIGYVCQYQLNDFGAAVASGDLNRGDLHECMILTKNPTTTGVTNRVWYFRFFGGGASSVVNSGAQDGAGDLGNTISPATFKMDLVQIPAGSYIIAAFDFPIDTKSFDVTIFPQYHGHAHVALPEASQ